jgi:hypothetical protein
MAATPSIINNTSAVRILVSCRHMKRRSPTVPISGVFSLN